MTTEDADQKKKDDRRKLLLLLLLLLMTHTEEDLTSAASMLANGSGQTGVFGHNATQILADAHAHAAYIGRMLAGSTAAFGDTDVQFGQSVAMEQLSFLQGFARDLTAGRYQVTAEDGTVTVSEVAIQARAKLYAKRLLGSVNEAWVLALPADTLIYWRLGGTEDHCSDCPELAEASPYTAITLPTYPASGETECLSNCLCYLETGGGLIGIIPSELEGLIS